MHDTQTVRDANMKILVLDDSVERQIAFKAWLDSDDVTCIETAKECIDLLDSQTWNVVFLDHDLGGETMVSSGPGTGYEVAQWLVDHPDKIPGQVVVHSMNPVGRNNIRQLISRVLPGVETAPGCWLRGVKK